MNNKLVLEVETPKTAGERIANAYDPDQFLTDWLAKRSLARMLEKEFKLRDLAILGNVKEYLGGTNND